MSMPVAPAEAELRAHACRLLAADAPFMLRAEVVEEGVGGDLQRVAQRDRPVGAPPAFWNDDAPIWIDAGVVDSRVRA